MRRLFLFALLAALGAAAPAAAAAPEPRIALTEEGGLLRHKPSGLVLPETLGALRRTASLPGNPAIVLYGHAGAPADDPRQLAVAVGIAKASPGIERMRERSRAHAAGEATLEILSEGPFDWPGGAGADTFHGAYAVGDLRKLYWHAWIRGYGITVLVATPRSEVAEAEAIAAAVATRIFGSAP